MKVADPVWGEPEAVRLLGELHGALTRLEVGASREAFASSENWGVCFRPRTSKALGEGQFVAQIEVLPRTEASAQVEFPSPKVWGITVVGADGKLYRAKANPDQPLRREFRSVLPEGRYRAGLPGFGGRVVPMSKDVVLQFDLRAAAKGRRDLAGEMAARGAGAAAAPAPVVVEQGGVRVELRERSQGVCRLLVSGGGDAPGAVGYELGEARGEIEAKGVEGGWRAGADLEMTLVAAVQGELKVSLRSG